MKNATVKIRVSKADKTELETFASEAGQTISDILRSAIAETMKGQVAGHQRRERIAKLRRVTNQMLAAFEAKPIDVPTLKSIAAQVRNAASKVLA